MSRSGRCEPLLVKETDVDLDAVVSGNPSQMLAAERQYNRKLVELATFCGVDWSPESGTLPPVELFSDVRLAKYFAALLEQYGAGASRRKTSLAAINDALKKLGLPNIWEFKHEYPKLSLILKVKLCVLLHVLVNCFVLLYY